MKILIIRTTPNKVCLNTYNLQEIGLAKALIRKGHQCDVAYYGGKEKDHYEIVNFDDKLSVKILWLRGVGVFYEGIYPSLMKYVNNYNIIQVGGYVGITSWILNFFVQKKVINYQGPYYCASNSGDIRKARILDHTLLLLSRKKNMIVYTKSILATEYMKSKGLKDVTTVGVGLDLDNIRPSLNEFNDNEFIKKLKEGKGSGKYLLYIGVLEERRNIKFLLNMFAKISKSRSEYKLILIGKGKEEYVDECFKLIRKLNIEKKIIYQNSLEQRYIKAVYEIADAFILPTKYEIFGMVILEAMYFGLPVFTTYNGGSSTLINEENGVILDNYNPDSWAVKVDQILSDKLKVESISKMAHKTIADNYTWDALSDKILMIYEKRLKENNG